MKETERERLDDITAWKERHGSSSDSPRELFQQVSHIAVCMSYDLIDKLRWWEKETLKLSDEEIEKRLPHMSRFLDGLKTAYLEFSEVDF